MALARLARNGVRDSFAADSVVRRVFGNYIDQKGVLSEALYGSKCYSSLVRNASSPNRHLGYLQELGGMERSSLGSRGIRVSPQYESPSAEAVVENCDFMEDDDSHLPGLEATKPNEKPRVVVLGTGWAGCRFLKGLNTELYDIVCISPRNHMVFTPLLASTCVGTLEFRSVAEPVSRIQSALGGSPNSYFYLASCTGIDMEKHEVYCETVSSEGLQRQPYRFKVAYDKLVIASGSEPLTFNINGVKEHASFLREVQHAQEIRKKLLLNLMLSENPVKDISGAVSSAGAGLQQLSLQQEISAPPAGDNPAVIIPSHMQVPTPDCSHLSFGSFGPGNSAGFSASFLSKTLKSISDEASTAPDDSSVEHLDSRNHETSKENVGPPSSSQPEVLKQDGAVEATHGYQYPLPSSQLSYVIESATQVNAAGYSYSQTHSQMQSLSSFSSVLVTEQDMVETFLRPFEMCVKESDASSVMCSYNRVNGIPTCADPKLLSDTIRGDWNLHGYIVSDCDSIEVLVDGHKWLGDSKEDAVAHVLKAGLDLDCGDYYPNFTMPAVNMGKVRESDIDKALFYLYNVLMRLGFFDGSPAYATLGKDDVCTKENIELATDAARQGIVLLKNENNTLLGLSPAQ